LHISLAAFALTSLMGCAVQRQPDGVLLNTRPGTVRVEVWSDRVIRVTYAPGDRPPELDSLSVIGKPDATAKWSLHETPNCVVIETAALRAKVDRQTGAVGFYDL